MPSGSTSPPEAEQAQHEGLGEANEETAPTALSPVAGWQDAHLVTTRSRPKYLETRLFEAFYTKYHERVDQAYAQGKQSLPRGMQRVRLARLHASFDVTWPRDTTRDLRHGEDCKDWDYRNPKCEKCVEQALGPLCEVTLTAASGIPLGTYLEKDLGFLASGYAERNYGLLKRILRKAGFQVEGALVYSEGKRYRASRWRQFQALGLYLCHQEHYVVAEGRATKKTGRCFELYDGWDPEGLLNQIQKMNLGEQTPIPTAEAEGLFSSAGLAYSKCYVPTRWHAAKLANEFATGYFWPLGRIRWINPRAPPAEREERKHPLDFWRGTDQLDVTEHNYHCLWNEDADEPRYDCAPQDLRRYNEFATPKMALSQHGATMRLVEPGADGYEDEEDEEFDLLDCIDQPDGNGDYATD